MLKINVKDAAGILKHYDLPSNARQTVGKLIQQRLLSETYSKVVEEANRTLKTSKAEYIDGIVLKKNYIGLEGWLPNAIEEGVSGFDMKDGFSRSSKRKFNKDGGWYLTIPFRIKSPSASYGNKMSWQIYRAVRAGKSYDAGAKGQRSGFSDLATGRVFKMYQHKSPILQGIRENKNSSGGSTYNTFRRVSSNSSPESWIHKGIMAHRILDKAWTKVDVDAIIEDTLNNL